MTRALLLRGCLVLAFTFAVLSIWVNAALAGVIIMIALAYLLCCGHQKAVWHDGWLAAHDHHKIGEGHKHLREYTHHLAGQGV